MLGVVRRHFKPEFLNRLDDLVVFDSLFTEELTSIVDIQIGQLARRLELDVTDAAREWLALRACWQMITRLSDLVDRVPTLRRGVRPIGDEAARRPSCGPVAGS